MACRRVVITGLGPVTPVGIGKDRFWEGLRSGESGVRRVDDRIDLSGIEVQIGAPVADFDPLTFMDRRRARRIDRATQFALASAHLAVTDAGLSPADLPAERSGVVVGTGIGGLETMAENFALLTEGGPRKVSPFFIPGLMPNALSAEISIDLGLRGPNFGVVSACASGAHAIGIAAELVRSGILDAALAGGAEAVLLRMAYAGFDQLGALSKRNGEPEKASRPFDLDRDGFVMGEGAGVVVLEEAERARARGAPVYAEIAGFGMTADAFHITAPSEDGEGAARAISLALAQAGLRPEEVDYVNAHGTSTLLNDRAETRAIKTALGGAARRVKISSTKSQIGHLLGAAGSVEAIATVLSLLHGHIPATQNHEHPDPDCDLDYTATSADLPIRIALSNSFGFGGQNAVLVFRKVEETPA